MLGYIPRSRTAGSYDSSIFSFLRNLHPVFFVVASHVYISHQQCTNVAFSLHSQQHCCLFIIAILTGLQWYLVLICFFLIFSDVELLFMYLLTFCMSSLEKYLFRSSAHFLIGFFFWCSFVCVLCVFSISPPYQMYCFQISSPI